MVEFKPFNCFQYVRGLNKRNMECVNIDIFEIHKATQCSLQQWQRQEAGGLLRNLVAFDVEGTRKEWFKNERSAALEIFWELSLMSAALCWRNPLILPTKISSYFYIPNELVCYGIYFKHIRSMKGPDKHKIHTPGQFYVSGFFIY